MGVRSAIRELFGRGPRRPARRAYGGARFNRLTSDWVSSSTSADSEVRSSFKMLRNRARQMCRDNDYARQALRALEMNVVGHGIRHQGQVRMQRGGRLDEAMNAQIHAAWESWGHKSRCD